MKQVWWKQTIIFLTVLLVLLAGYVWADRMFGTVTYLKSSTDLEKVLETASSTESDEELVAVPAWPQQLDAAEYDRRMLSLVNYLPSGPTVTSSTTTDASGAELVLVSTSTPASPLRYSSSTNVTIDNKLWPPENVYPNGDAVLPFKRILAYYGNFYSRHMGILGEFESEVVLERLAQAQAEWEAADPDTPVLPAIEYIAMVAQADAGADGMYRTMMPDKEIEKAYALAQQIDGVMILDIQTGLSPLQTELPRFKKYLERPDVFFALDPEFSMHDGARPGTVIGSLSAQEINYAIKYMSEIVRENQLPPKVLLVHRFTQDMVTDASSIQPTPEVQVVIVMDGWGPSALKRATYRHIIEPEPVQFTGLKVFYKNDLKPPSTGLLSPEEILQLYPAPIYIQYQ
jgi:hypothetical protein